MGKGSSDLEKLRAQLRAEYRKPWQEARKEKGMDEKRLAELEALANAATPGPWVPKHVKTVFTNGECEHEVRSAEDGKVVAAIRFRSQGGEIGEDVEDRDLAFIAAARAAVPELVAEVRRLRAECSGLASHVVDSGGVPASALRRAERERCAKYVRSAIVPNMQEKAVEDALLLVAADLRALPDEG